MSRHDEKIIPTLDDVIKPGDLDKSVLGEISSADDDISEESIELFTDTSAGVDDAFDDEFEKIYADTDDNTDDNSDDNAASGNTPRGEALDDDLLLETIEDETSAKTIGDSIDDLIDDDMDADHEDLVDKIVAERFPEDSTLLLDDDDAIDIPETEAEHEFEVASYSDNTSAADNSETQSPADASAAPTAASEPLTAVGADVNVKQLVDDITTRLMPEIEWKVRVRLREILDELFPGK